MDPGAADLDLISCSAEPFVMLAHVLAHKASKRSAASETAADDQELTSAGTPFRQAAEPATAAVLACPHLSLATSLGGTSIA